MHHTLIREEKIDLGTFELAVSDVPNAEFHSIHSRLKTLKATRSKHLVRFFITFSKNRKVIQRWLIGISSHLLSSHLVPYHLLSSHLTAYSHLIFSHLLSSTLLPSPLFPSSHLGRVEP